MFAENGRGKSWTATVTASSRNTAADSLERLKEWLAAVADGKLPTSRKTDG